MIGTLAPYLRTAGRMAAALAIAILAVAVVARLGLEPASVVTPLAAVVVVLALFWYRAEEGLGVFLLFTLIADTLGVVLPADVRYFDELGLLLLVPAAVARYRIPNGRLRMGVAEWAMGVVAVMGIVSSLVASVPAGTWIPGFLLLFKGVAFFYLVWWLPLRLPEVERVGVTILAAAGIIVALGAWELADPAGFQRTIGLPPYTEVRGGLTVVKSIFPHPAVFGWITVFASLFIYAWALVRRVWWLLPVGFVFNAATILSGRRTPILGLLIAVGVGVLWYAWTSRSGGRLVSRFVPVLATVALLLALFFPVLGDLADQTQEEYGGSRAFIDALFSPDVGKDRIAQMAPRSALYAASVEIARDHFPFGAGLGRYGSYMSRADFSDLYEEYGLNQVWGLSAGNPNAISDTFWPSVLGETGMGGLVGFAVFVAAIAVRLWHGTALRSLVAYPIALGTLLVFAQGLVASLTAATYVAPPIVFFVFGTSGALLSLAAGSPGDGPRAGGRPTSDSDADVA